MDEPARAGKVRQLPLSSRITRWRTIRHSPQSRRNAGRTDTRSKVMRQTVVLCTMPTFKILYLVLKNSHSQHKMLKMSIRAGEFSKKKNIHHGQNRVFGKKKCPQKIGESYAQFSPSSIWVNVLTQILTNAVTITQIEEGENWA